MSQLTASTLMIIAAVAVVAPLLSELTGRIGIPDVVIQLTLGIILGPQVLGLANPDSVVKTLSTIGLAYLMFLAGYELDLIKIKGAPLRRAGAGWLASLCIAMLAGVVMVAAGLHGSPIVLALALTSTALGTLLPVLRDGHLIEGPFGANMMAIGTLGEFAPIVAVAILLSHRRPALTTGFLALFALVAVATALLAGRRKPKRFVALLHRHLHTSAQLPIRMSILLIIGLVCLASELGLDILLGAFAAGVVVHFLSDGDDREVVGVKLDAIGYGFLIPIFFVTSGMALDIDAFVAKPSSLLLVPLFVVLLLVVRGVPTLVLARSDLPRAQRLPLALLSSTALPLIVVVTTLGIDAKTMSSSVAAALIGAGMMSVLVFPLVAKLLLARMAPSPASIAAGTSAAASAVTAEALG